MIQLNQPNKGKFMKSSITQLADIAEQVRSEYQSLKTKQSNNDHEINDLYHIIELLNINAAQTSKVTKLLKAALRLRRELKEQQSACQMAMQGTIEKIPLSVEFSRRRSVREAQYRGEALVAFDRLFPKV